MSKIIDEDNLNNDEIHCINNAPDSEVAIKAWLKLQHRLFADHRHSAETHSAHYRERARAIIGPENDDLDDFIGFAWYDLNDKFASKRLLRSYDPEYPRANVVSYLCAYNAIKRQYKHYRKMETDGPIGLVRPFGVDEDGTSEEEKIVDQQTETGLSDVVCDSMDWILRHRKLVLRCTKGDHFDHSETLAGLQFYLGIDRTNDLMNRLLEHVEKEVQQSAVAQNLDETAPAWIKAEHKKAQERLQQQRNDIIIALRVKDGQVISFDPQSKTQQEITRALQRNAFERLFYPLNAEQIMVLMHSRIKNTIQTQEKHPARVGSKPAAERIKNTVVKQRERYEKKLPSLIPFDRDECEDFWERRSTKERRRDKEPQ